MLLPLGPWSLNLSYMLAVAWVKLVSTIHPRNSLWESLGLAKAKISKMHDLHHVCRRSLGVRNSFKEYKGSFTSLEIKQIYLYLFQIRKNLLMVNCKTEESSSNKFVPRQNTSNRPECQPKTDAVILKQKDNPSLRNTMGNAVNTICRAPMHTHH